MMANIQKAQFISIWLINLSLLFMLIATQTTFKMHKQLNQLDLVLIIVNQHWFTVFIKLQHQWSYLSLSWFFLLFFI